MVGFDKSTARVIAVIALLVVAAWALRGYLPGDEPVPDRQQRPPSSPAALIFDIALLSISVAIIGTAIVARLRNRKARRQGPPPLPGSRGSIGRPTWRFWIIALALVMGWVLFVMLLTRLGLHGPVDQAPSGPPTIADPNGAPPATANPVPRQPDPSKKPGPDIVGYLVPPMLVLMALTVVGTAVMSRRGRRAAAPPSTRGERPEPPAHHAESLVRAAELGLAEIGDLSREPREAIIACYAAMEHELTHVPGAVPLDCDTPSEVLARAVGHHALNADSATRLVELFEEARFSSHVMNEGHRDIAVDALRLVLADLRSLA